MSSLEIADNEHISQNYYKLRVEMGDSPVPWPGQFYQIRCSSLTDPLFRRPFSVHRILEVEGSWSLEILYRLVGRGTEWLSQRKRGELLDILGPFGNGFRIDESPDPILLVARGIGIAPLYAVGEEVRNKNSKRNIFIMMGARIGERIFYRAECEVFGDVFLYTDDGSRGFRGTAPELLRNLVQQKRIPERLHLYACGPPQMLKDLAQLAQELNFDGQAALEERMGCGFGACLACACPLRPDEIVRNSQWEKPALHWSADGTQVYSLICKDGPVYDLKEVDWDEWTA
jgi:dihydroorotate dehydrogenase electron transfer subunit